MVVLERDALPRQKPCGGGISTRVLTRFPWLPSALPRVQAHPVSSLYLEGPSGGVFRTQANGPVVILIRRVEFDYLLASLAREAGAAIVAPAAAQASQDGRRHAGTRDGRESRAVRDRSRRRQQRDRGASGSTPAGRARSWPST